MRTNYLFVFYAGVACGTLAEILLGPVVVLSTPIIWILGASICAGIFGYSAAKHAYNGIPWRDTTITREHLMGLFALHICVNTVWAVALVSRYVWSIMP